MKEECNNCGKKGEVFKQLPDYYELHNEHHKLLEIMNKAMEAEWTGKCKFCKEEA